MSLLLTLNIFHTFFYFSVSISFYWGESRFIANVHFISERANQHVRGNICNFESTVGIYQKSNSDFNKVSLIILTELQNKHLIKTWNYEADIKNNYLTVIAPCEVHYFKYFLCFLIFLEREILSHCIAQDCRAITSL